MTTPKAARVAAAMLARCFAPVPCYTQSYVYDVAVLASAPVVGVCVMAVLVVTVVAQIKYSVAT